MPNRGFEPRSSSIWARRLYQSWASSACTITSLLGESNPDCLRTEEACLPLPLSRRELMATIAGALGGSRTRNYTALNRARLPVAARAPGAATRGRTGAVRGTKAEPQAVRGGIAAHHGFEPRFAHSECAVLPVGRMGTGCGRRDSNAQTARSELARSSSCRHFRVRRRGFEPRLHGLRVRCSSQLS